MTTWQLAAKLRALLSAGERRRWLALGPLLVLTGVIELLGTALVFMLVRVAGDPAAARTLPAWRRLLSVLPEAGARALGQASDRSIVLAAGVFVAVFFVFRSLVLLIVSGAQSRAVADTIAGISSRMFGSYLAAPYPTHLRYTSSELAYDATVAVERAVQTGLGSLTQVFAELLVSLGLVVFLLIAAPVVTLGTASALGVFVAATLVLTKRGSRRWGKESEQRGRQALKDAQESLGGIREIKILGREDAFEQSFLATQKSLARARRRHGWLVTVPRVAIETIFVSSVVLVVALATLGGRSGRDVVPLLGLFAYAGFRLIPSANRLLLHVDALRSAAALIDRLTSHRTAFLRDLSQAEPEPTQGAIEFRDQLTIEGLSYRYGEGAPFVLSDVSATIMRGQSIGVVGPTGAGKSTLIDLIFGLLEPSTGRIAVDGVDIRRARRAWQRRIGYVPQTAFLFADSIRQNIALGIPAAAIDEARVREALELVQLASFVDALPAGLDTEIGERGIRLSGGQRQRVAIARALYHDPELLVLDEATAALDNKTERDLTEAIERLRGRKTLIVIAHRLTTVQRCDALMFLSHGRLQAMAPFAELLRDNAEFRAMASATLTPPE
ncbi:MAG TPA: ABC transporter ATP-binding protein [Polyangia bacterium]|nr:ABC transporter ATP-binding protein [Polyangia bacterium]